MTFAEQMDEVESLFKKVEASTRRFLAGGMTNNEDTLKAIFRLNNEIGRVAKSHPGKNSNLRELQAYVNMVTVGLKHGRPNDLREGLIGAEQAIRKSNDSTV